ncbi:cytochrome c-type biogenesis protein [Marinicellulosiphila megalodicopiae]|uniref:cytochrome c-type biogenesis protein n=1 Tax=Marinicellulosiphila megalodicopiae TaxID=2724896 RepID=UPI003BB057B8
MKKIIICLSLVLFFQSAVALEEHEYKFINNEQKALFVEMTEILRCPKCQNNNVADSNAEIAQDFRDKIYELVKKGQTKSEIKTYFTDRFGEFVNYETSVSLTTIWIWLIPILVLVLVFGFVFIFNRTKTQTELSNEALSEQEQKELDDIITLSKKGK